MDKNQLKKNIKAEEGSSAILLPSVGAFDSQEKSKATIQSAEGNLILEQTEIAKKLGISNNAMRRIAQAAKLEWQLIDGRRHYDFHVFINAIKLGK